jgi:hypothetical protein
MPTPFMHLISGQHLLADPALDESYRSLLTAHRGAFLLGNIAPDVRVSGGIARFMTHFYQCHSPYVPSAWEVMLGDYPALRRNGNDQAAAQIAFVAGYVAHLAMDVVFCRDVVYPYLVAVEDPLAHVQARLRLHWLLAWLDARDYAGLPGGLGPVLQAAQPHDWLPFVPDAALAEWRDMVADQLPPEGRSLTFDILGGRVQLSASEMAAVVEAPARMQADVWAYIPPDVVIQTEQAMYEQARLDMACYLAS